ncbi:hypothetical protein [Nocardioides conyzicola]|uniref:Uncharacterized protein n=1 Tax=Nocardioides conyzicola TaxID=1651781 RepID=A0ABP8Y113_9ACTN
MTADELRETWRRAVDLAARSVSPDPAVRTAAREEAAAWQSELEAAPSAGRRLAATLREAASRIA